MVQIPVCVQYVFRGREPEFLDSAELAMAVMGFISAASLPEDWDQAATELGEQRLHRRLEKFVARELAPRLARQGVIRLAGRRGR